MHPTHGVLFWLLVLIVYYIAGWIWSVWSCRAQCHQWAVKVLTSRQVWGILRFVVWIVIGFIAGSAFTAIIIALIFWIIEIIFDFICGGSSCCGAWCGRPDRCSPYWRRQHVCNDWCRDDCNWNRGHGHSPYFWSCIFWDLIIMLVGAFIGAGLLPELYLQDWVYGGYFGYALEFWITAAIVAIILTLLYRFAVCRMTCDKCIQAILLDPRTLLVIQSAYFLILGILSGAPVYVAFFWLILWEILDRLLGCCFYEFREPWYKTAEAFVWCLLAFVVGAELLRPLLYQNMYPTSYISS